MSWGRMAPLLATILVTCWAHAEDTSADGSLMSNAKPATTTARETGQGLGDMVGTATVAPPQARTHRAVMRDGVHAEGQLPARVTQQLLALGEGLCDHLALLDPLGLVVTLSRQPGDMAGHGVAQAWGSHRPRHRSKGRGTLPISLPSSGQGHQGRWMGSLGMEPPALSAGSPRPIEPIDTSLGTTANVSGCRMRQEGSHGSGGVGCCPQGPTCTRCASR